MTPGTFRIVPTLSNAFYPEIEAEIALLLADSAESHAAGLLSEGEAPMTRAEAVQQIAQDDDEYDFSSGSLRHFRRNLVDLGVYRVHDPNAVTVSTIKHRAWCFVLDGVKYDFESWAPLLAPEHAR